MRQEKTFKEILQEKLETQTHKGFDGGAGADSVSFYREVSREVSEGWVPFFNIASKSKVFPRGKSPFANEKAKFKSEPSVPPAPLPPEIRLALADLNSDASFIYMSWREFNAPAFDKQSISEKELKKAFRFLAKKFHPDRTGSGDARMFMRVRLEYDLLAEHFEKLAA